jgi:uncharacterized phage-associated protein
VTFHFNERKTAQAAAYLLRKRGGRWTYGQIIKLLYLADRKKLLERGTPITGDYFVSLEHGPALSLIYEVIRDGPSEELGREWAAYVSSPRDFYIEALKDETDELSRYELRILDEIDEQFGSMSFTQLRNYTHHHLGEWENPGHSSKPIPPERIFHVERRPQEEIDLATEKAEAAWSINPPR